MSLKQVIPMSKCGAIAHLSCSAQLQKREGTASTEREQGLTACSEGMKWEMLGQVDSHEPHTNRGRRSVPPHPPAAHGSSTGSCLPRKHPAAAQPRAQSGHHAAPSRRTQRFWGRTRTEMTTQQRMPEGM